MNLNAALIASMNALKRKQLFRSLTQAQLQTILRDWRFWARPEQLPPQLKWRTWAFLGGRGAGKTRAASEWVVEMAELGNAENIALIGPTYQDARDVMVEGHSGILNVAHEDFRPVFEPSNRRLVWPNGAKAYLYSAEAPQSLRGPQFDLAWGDEFAAWIDGDAVLDLLRPALRIGENPRLMLTTTPRPVPWVKALFEDPNCIVRHSSSMANRANLADGVIEELEQRWAGSIWARQELLGELIEDPEGALWNREDIKNARKISMPETYDEIVVAIDPPASHHEKSDTCGIIVAGRFDNIAVVLDDLSIQGKSPDEWARIAADAYELYGANRIIAEANQGGEMVRTIISLHAPKALVTLKYAQKSKRMRAEPINLLYRQGRIGHANHMPHLEDEMCRFGAQGFKKSPDRLDALVWALTHLLINNSDPRARSL